MSLVPAACPTAESVALHTPSFTRAIRARTKGGGGDDERGSSRGGRVAAWPRGGQVAASLGGASHLRASRGTHVLVTVGGAALCAFLRQGRGRKRRTQTWRWLQGGDTVECRAYGAGQAGCPLLTATDAPATRAALTLCAVTYCLRAGSRAVPCYGAVRVCGARHEQSGERACVCTIRIVDPEGV